jgi:hypothetical protein
MNRELVNRKRTWVLLTAAFIALPALVLTGGGVMASHSGGFSTADGESSGVERRANVPNALGTCGGEVFPNSVTAQATYTYPAPGTGPARGVVSVSGVDSAHNVRTFQGVVNVFWEAQTVWDGPKGTTVAGGHATNCQFGTPWPVTTASITSVQGSGSLSCLDANRDAASNYRRLPNGDEEVTLKFTSCGFSGGTINNAQVRLIDDLHAFCADIDGATSPGVDYCASNYLIGLVDLPPA